MSLGEAPSYIGITTFTEKWQTLALLERFPLRALPNYRLMVGVPASLSTLRGKPDGKRVRYPKVEEIRKIFPNHFRTLNLVRYRTEDPYTLCSQLELLGVLSGPDLQGFQLDISWPPISELLLWRINHEHEYLVLRVGRRDLREYSNDVQRITEMIGRYWGIVNYVLIDQSNDLFDLSLAKEIFMALEEKRMDVRFVIGGALGGGALDGLKPVLDRYRDRGLSIQTGERLLSPVDTLDMNLSRDYVAQASHIL